MVRRGRRSRQMRVARVGEPRGGFKTGEIGASGRHYGDGWEYE
jgi:hypothetical protein